MNAHNNKNSSRTLCRITTFLTSVLFATLPMFTAAADATKSNVFEDEARWFQIELILFSQQTDLALDAEQWPDIQGLELPEKFLELSFPPATASSEGITESTGGTATTDESTITLEQDPALSIAAEEGAEESSDMPIAYQILAEDEHQLTEMAKKLRRSKNRNLLLHVAWQQPTYDRKQAEPMYLVTGITDPLPPTESELTKESIPSNNAPEGGNTLPFILEYATEEDIKIGPADPRFTGTVTLSVERYLHIATDLIYRRPVTQHSPTPIPDLDLWYDRPYPTLNEPQGPAYQQTTWQAVRGFQLKESRRMRSTEIHYLDHPFMGIVVVVTPVELPEPAEEIEQTSPMNILSAPSRTKKTPPQ